MPNAAENQSAHTTSTVPRGLGRRSGSRTIAPAHRNGTRRQLRYHQLLIMVGRARYATVRTAIAIGEKNGRRTRRCFHPKYTRKTAGTSDTLPQRVSAPEASSHRWPTVSQGGR